jgi:hypothetical protein
MTGTLLPSAEAASCPQLAEGDIRVECAPGAGQVEVSDLTG